MKVALIHEHLAQDGGAERAFKALADLFPNAPIYTLLYHDKQVDRYFSNRNVQTSVIQRLPGGTRFYQWYMPFMPMAVEFFDLREFDVVISSASAFAKGVITGTDTLHISYCHSPTRYIWDYTHQYIKELKYNRFLKKIASLILNYVRIWDKAAADRVDLFIANSKCVQRRIKKFYRRESTVIYPPVDTKNYYISEESGSYFLIGGRIVPYKRIDLVIEAFRGLDDKLLVFGDGVDLPRLKKLAAGAANIEFLGRVDDQRKYELYAKCTAFINPQEEDFGITTIETMAAGRPVVAFNRGGAAELVKDGLNGVKFDYQTVPSLRMALEKIKDLKFNPKVVRSYALGFSEERFKGEILAFVEEAYARFAREKSLL